jgi:hypothetical protein
LVGPTRLFGPGATYSVFLWALFAGALAPFPLWYYQRRYPNTRLKYINLPVLLNGPSAAPPATGVNYASFFVVAYIFREFNFPLLFNFGVSFESNPMMADMAGHGSLG